MKRPKSDIPKGAREVILREYRRDGSFEQLRLVKCILNRRTVGRRAYDGNGAMVIETPLKKGKKHGREIIWNPLGELESIEPYVNGQLHGVARQYGTNGKVIGSYRFVRGTGFDIWRGNHKRGVPLISEIHSIRNSVPHGYEWWLEEDQRSVWQERHWRNGKRHGIERIWDSAKLDEGYPAFWISGKRVGKLMYRKAALKDRTLPIYEEKDDHPARTFPPKIRRILKD